VAALVGGPVIANEKTTSLPSHAAPEGNRSIAPASGTSVPDQLPDVVYSSLVKLKFAVV